MRESKEKQNFLKHTASGLFRSFSKKKSDSKESNKAAVSQQAAKPPSKELILAVLKGEAVKVEQLLSKRRYNLNEFFITSSVSRNRSNLLLISLRRLYYGSKDPKYKIIVRLLLEHGADVNIKDSDDESPLYQSIMNENIEMIQLLLEHGANPNSKSEYILGYPPLLYVLIDNTRVDHEDIVRLLLKAGANVNLSDEDGDTPLHVAVSSADQPNSLNIIKLLIEAGADVNAKSQGIQAGTTPLHTLCRYKTKNIKVLQLLLDEGAEVTVEDEDGYTPLYLACERNNLNIVKKLLPLIGSTINHATPHGTPLAAACRSEYVQIAKMLLEAGADPRNILVENHEAYYQDIAKRAEEQLASKETEPRDLLQYDWHIDLAEKVIKMLRKNSRPSSIPAKSFVGYSSEIESLLRSVAINNDTIREIANEIASRTVRMINSDQQLTKQSSDKIKKLIVAALLKTGKLVDISDNQSSKDLKSRKVLTVSLYEELGIYLKDKNVFSEKDGIFDEGEIKISIKHGINAWNRSKIKARKIKIKEKERIYALEEEALSSVPPNKEKSKSAKATFSQAAAPSHSPSTAPPANTNAAVISQKPLISSGVANSTLNSNSAFFQPVVQQALIQGIKKLGHAVEQNIENIHQTEAYLNAVENSQPLSSVPQPTYDPTFFAPQPSYVQPTSQDYAVGFGFAAPSFDAGFNGGW